jgi:hypothetical protein
MPASTRHASADHAIQKMPAPATCPEPLARATSSDTPAYKTAALSITELLKMSDTATQQHSSTATQQRKGTHVPRPISSINDEPPADPQVSSILYEYEATTHHRAATAA